MAKAGGIFIINEYYSEGYLRSCCWNKIKYMVEDMHDHPLNKTKAFVSRSRQDESHIERPYSWIKWTISSKFNGLINWDIRKNKVPYSTFLEALETHKNRYLVEDFVVERIEFGFYDNTLISLINSLIKEYDSKIKKIEDDTEIFVTYKNAPVAYSRNDGINIDNIKKINEIAIKRLKFKIGIMVLKHINIYDKKETRNFDFALSDRNVVHKIIKDHINNERWFLLPEVKRLDKTVYPGSIKTYKRDTSRSWSLISDEEVR